MNTLHGTSARYVRSVQTDDYVKPFLFEDSRDPGGLAKAIEESRKHIPGLIFNYPPFALWQPPETPQNQGENAASLWLDASRYTHNLYVHIPFCKQKCSYCYYSVVPNARDDLKWRYLRALESEASLYARTEMGTKKIDTVFPS